MSKLSDIEEKCRDIDGKQGACRILEYSDVLIETLGKLMDTESACVLNLAYQKLKEDPSQLSRVHYLLYNTL